MNKNTRLKKINKLHDKKKSDDIEYNISTYDNNLRLITERMPQAESFALGICVNTGSRDDFPEKSGLAHFMEHISFRRTQNRTGRRISTEFESLGAYTNAFTTKEVTCYYVRALTKHFSKCLDILTDVVFNPRFVASDVNKECSIIIEEIKTYEDDPEELIFDYADKLLFDSHGLGYPITGFEDSVKLIDCSELQKFHDQLYSPSNMIVSFAGNIPHSTIYNKLKNHFPDPFADTQYQKTAAPGLVNSSRIEVEKPFQQSHITYCRQAPSVTSEDRYALAVLNVVLGDGMSSRLNQRLRERHGLAYSVYSSLQLLADTGGIYIYAGTEEKKAAKTEKLIIEEINKLHTCDIKPSELNRAKEQIKSSTIMAFESLSTRMQTLAKSQFQTGQRETAGETIQKIDEVTNDDMARVCSRYFKIDDWSSVLFLPE